RGPSRPAVGTRHRPDEPRQSGSALPVPPPTSSTGRLVHRHDRRRAVLDPSVLDGSPTAAQTQPRPPPAGDRLRQQVNLVRARLGSRTVSCRPPDRPPSA